MSAFERTLKKHLVSRVVTFCMCVLFKETLSSCLILGWLVVSDYIVCMSMMLMTRGQQLVGISTGPMGFPVE